MAGRYGGLGDKEQMKLMLQEAYSTQSLKLQS